MPRLDSFLLILFLLIGGCGQDEASDLKRINSVLQSQEFDLRNSRTELYRYQAKALDTEYNTIAFPLRGTSQKYVVFLANPKNAREILSVPNSNVPFILNRNTLKEIRDRGLITLPLYHFLVTKVN